MAKILYTLKRRKDTEEYHLFESTLTVDNKCAPKPKSLCNKMDKNESDLTLILCKSENEARLFCATKGRSVCGTCVSHLYETYK
jgi:hypothetical protein